MTIRTPALRTPAFALAAIGLCLAAPAIAQTPNAFSNNDLGPVTGSVPPSFGLNSGANLDGEPLTRAISMQGQISVIFQSGDKLGVAHDTFQDGKVGADATPQSILKVLQQTAIEGLGQAVKAGAKSGHADVTATVYQFAADGDSIRAWAPVGVFINSTDMVLADNGQASFHTHVQFVPDNPANPAIQQTPPPFATPEPDAPPPLATPKEKPGGPPPNRLS